MPWTLNIGTQAPAQDRRYWVLAGAAILLGVALRLWGYFEYEFWLDESIWAGRILRSLSSPTRPIGYMYISQWLGELHNTEPVLRLPSLVVSIASMPLLLALCRKAQLSRPVSLLGLFVLAIHPWAITSSKEFKPYALELALHLGLLLLAASYLNSRKTRDLVLFVALAVVSPLFAWTVSMLLPWLFFALLTVTLRAQKRAHALIVFGGGTLTALTLAAIFFMRLTAAKRNPVRWGNRYDVFFVGDDIGAHARWLLEKTADIATFPARVRLFWGQGDLAQTAFNWLHIAAVIAGCVYLIRRRSFFYLVAWVGPWLTAIVLAAARLWPYGVFRTNVFMLAYSLLLALCGLQYFWEWASTRAYGRNVALACAVCFVLLTFPYRFSEAAQKSGGGHTASTRRALELIKQYEEASGRPPGKKFRLLLDNHACPAFKYYTQDHVVAREALGGYFEQMARKECYGKQPTLERRIRSKKAGGQFWLLASRTRTLESLEAQVVKRCTPDVLVHLPGPTLLAHCPGSGT